jgi:dolichol-phosphate mannosyltransferase
MLRKFISGGGNIFARTALGIPIPDCTSGYRCYRTSALAGLKLDQVRAQGYAFQVEMTYAVWRSGYQIREVPIVFLDRQVGQSKMSRAIFLEACRWVLSTRLHGSPVVQV